MFVFLDDYRKPEGATHDPHFPRIPYSHWTIVRDIDEFKKLIDEHLHEIEWIAFDHDLAEEHYPWNGNQHSDGRTGYDCAKYVVDQCIERKLWLPNFSCHSMNPAGRENILSYLESFRRTQQ